MIVYRLVIVTTFLILCFNLYGQKIFFDSNNKEFNSLAMYKDWNDYWVSSKNGFIHCSNGNKKYYHNTDSLSGIKGDWIQSKIFEDNQGNLYSTNYDYLLILNKYSNKFVSRKIIVNTDEVKSDYQISSIDTSSYLLRIRAQYNLINYNYKTHKVTEIISHSQNLFQIIPYQKDTIINIPNIKSTGIEVITKTINGWKTIKLLENYKFIKGILKDNILFLLTEQNLIEYNIKSNKSNILIYFKNKLVGKDIELHDDEIYILFKNSTINTYKLEESGFCQFVKGLPNDLIRLNNVYSIEIQNSELILSSKNEGIQLINLELLEKCIVNLNPNESNNFFNNNNLQNNSNREIDKKIKSRIHSTYAKSNYVYICTEAGVYTYNTTTKELRNQSIPVNNKIIYKLFYFNYEFYYATTDGFLYRGTSNLGRIGIVLDIHEDRYKVLLSTYDGIIELIQNGINTNLWEGKVYKSVLGKNGSKWFLNNDGLFRMDTTCQVIKYCGSEISGTQNTSISFENECGLVYLKYENKVLEVSEAYMDNQSAMPIVSLGSLTLDDKIIHDLNNIPNLYGQINISLNIEEKHCNSKHKVFIKIENIDKFWKEVTDNVAKISRLPFGKYKIQIMAIGSNNAASKILELPIYILPPFYLRWWFVLISGTSLLLIGFSISRIITKNRIRFQQLEIDKLQALQEQRQKLSQDLHDDLGSGLTKIKLLSSESNLYVKTTETTENINNITVNMMESLRDMLWSLDNNYDNFSGLISKIRNICQQQLTQTHISFKLIEIGNHTIPINGVIRRNVILIVKEVLTNVLKHSHASNVEVYLECDDKYLTINLIDNGFGFTDDKIISKSGYGLLSIRKRASLLNANIKFDGTNGVAVSLTVPL